jgi:hypothetical protein
MKYLCKTQVSIKGRKWKVYLLPSKQFVKMFGKTTAGATHYTNYSETRAIYLRPGYLTKVVIKHELVHAFLSTRPPTRSLHEFEEQVADLFAYSSDHINFLTTVIYWKFKNRLKTKQSF